LRGLGLNMSALDVLRADRVELDVRLIGRQREPLNSSMSSATVANGRHYSADQGEFLAVKATVRNRSGASNKLN
jgi:hypothetical protein